MDALNNALALLQEKTEECEELKKEVGRQRKYKAFSEMCDEGAQQLIIARDSLMSVGFTKEEALSIILSSIKMAQ